MMNKAIFASAVGLVALIEPGTAFAPVSNTNVRVNTELAATSDRRELLGNLAKALGGVAAAAGASQQFIGDQSPTLLAGLQNPAGGNFRGKFKGQSFTPGKGMREHESFDTLTAGLQNPAGGNFRGKFKGQSFTPGKGMRDHESFDMLTAGLQNPAGGNFRGKFKGQSFTPGKGMRDHESFDELC
jgi:hypothetical protein